MTFFDVGGVPSTFRSVFVDGVVYGMGILLERMSFIT